MTKLAIAAAIVLVACVIARWQRETVVIRPYLAEGDDGLLPMDPRLVMA